jgi:hypothetical protein
VRSPIASSFRSPGAQDELRLQLAQPLLQPDRVLVRVHEPLDPGVEAGQLRRGALANVL